MHFDFVGIQGPIFAAVDAQGREPWRGTCIRLCDIVIYVISFCVVGVLIIFCGRRFYVLFFFTDGSIQLWEWKLWNICMCSINFSIENFTCHQKVSLRPNIQICAFRVDSTIMSLFIYCTCVNAILILLQPIIFNVSYIKTEKILLNTLIQNVYVIAKRNTV